MWLINTAFNKDEAGAGCVVPNPHTRRGQRLRLRTGMVHVFFEGNGARADEANLLEGDNTGAVYDGGVCVRIDHGRLQAVCGFSRIENDVDAAFEILGYMRGQGGTGATKEVCAGCGDGDSDSQQECMRDRMARNADTDERPSRGNGVGDGGTAGQEQGERPGPEGVHKVYRIGGDLPCNHRQHAAVSKMHDEGVPAGALFCRKDFCDSLRIQCIRPKPVDRFGGKGHRTAAFQCCCCPFDCRAAGGRIEVGGVNLESEGLHGRLR